MSTTAAAPRIWLLLGPKAGDNTQLRALADHLQRHHGYQCEARELTFRSTELLTNLALGVTLAGLRSGRAALQPPWPDIVLTAGRRNEPVARWIARASAGHTLLVHVGRPWAHPRRFDLVVTTPQYQVPAAPNVLTVPLPLLPPSTTLVPPDAAVQSWMLLPRPHLAVLVGGNSGAFRFTARTGRDLGVAVTAYARQIGASVLVATSPRTPAAASAALRAALPTPNHFFDWHTDARAANPYRAYLASADEFVVTGESGSMLAEAVASGKPVAVFTPPRTVAGAWRWKPLTFYLAQWFGPRRMRRDIERLHAAMAARGYVHTLGAAPSAAAGRAAYSAEATLNQVALRVVALRASATAAGEAPARR